jgi:ABC-type antimicrobial peptide transport system permease subunit
LVEVLQQGARLIIAGAVMGVLGSVAATRVLRAFLFEIEPTDPWVFLSGVLVVAVTAFLACYLPARRATRVDPVIALRYE